MVWNYGEDTIVNEPTGENTYLYGIFKKQMGLLWLELSIHTPTKNKEIGQISSVDQEKVSIVFCIYSFLYICVHQVYIKTLEQPL